MTTAERTASPAANAATSPSAPRTVAVTGAAGPVGSRLVAALAAGPDVAQVVAVDTRRGAADGARWRLCDLRDPALAGRLAGTDVLVHLAAPLWGDLSAPAPGAIEPLGVADGTRLALDAAAQAGVAHVVLVTSAAVYGAAADNPVPLAEDAPLRAAEDGSPAELLEVERLAAGARARCDVTVVRPAAVVGPGIDTVVTRHLAAVRLLAVREARACWQFCHVEDLVSALQHVVTGRADLDGRPPEVVTVGSDGWLEQQEVEALTGHRRIQVPASLAFATAERLHRVGVSPSPASELAYVVYPWVVDSATLHRTGWRARHGNVDALREVMEQMSGQRVIAGRRVGLRDATVAGASAAGATAAVLGAAALVRHARRSRGR